MRRVAVIGCGGSGKTTLANELAARLDLPVVHIDSHYWRTVDRERVASTPEQWRACHRGLISDKEWVIDGMKLGVLGERLDRADAVIYLDLPTPECLSGILRRRLRYRGRLRPDVGVYDRINFEFLRWVWSFRRLICAVAITPARQKQRYSAPYRSCIAPRGPLASGRTRPIAVIVTANLPPSAPQERLGLPLAAE